MSIHRDWPRPSRWRLADQDVIADLEWIRRELRFLQISKAAPEILIQQWETAINDCAKEIKEHFLLTNRIFLRQTLAQIQQEIILVTPREKLDAIWITLKKKLDSIDDDDKKDSPAEKLVKKIDEFFSSEVQAKDAEPIARRRIRAVRKFIDDGLMLDLAAAYSLKRTAEALVFYLFVLLSGILVFLFENDRCSTGGIAACRTPSGAMGLALFGALGGTISAILRPNPGKSDKGDKSNRGLNLLTQFSFMRVLLGGVSGLFLFLLVRSEVLNVHLPYLAVCALAMAFGFSERALISALSATANRLDLEIARSTGLSGSGKPKSDSAAGMEK
jgi:hypothetical protein